MKVRLKLTSKLALLFMLFVALSIALTGALAYRSARDALQNATISGLASASMEKEAALNNWIEEGERHVAALAASPQLRAHVVALVAAAPGSADPSRRSRLPVGRAIVMDRPRALFPVPVRDRAGIRPDHRRHRL